MEYICLKTRKEFYLLGLASGFIAAESCAAVTLTGGAAGAAGAAGGIAGELIGAFRLGDKLKRRFPMSKYKLKCWKKFLRGELQRLHTECRKRIEESTDKTFSEMNEKLVLDKERASKEKAKLMKESHDLNIWTSELESIENNLRKTEREFKTLDNE